MGTKDGCGNGNKTRARTKKTTDFDCSLREGEKLEETKECFTKHCTNEFYKLNKITVQVLEGEYPGTSKEWEMTIKGPNGFTCTTSAISGLDRGVRKSITGTDLGRCGTAHKKLVLEDFQSMDTLKLYVKPVERLNDMTVTNVDIYNCNTNYGGSGDTWKIGIQNHCDLSKLTNFELGEWSHLSGKNLLGECYTKKKNDWQSYFKVDFKSDGTDDMAICDMKFMTRGTFRSAEYSHHESNNYWTNDDYGKTSEYIGWGPLKKKNEHENQIKIENVELEFCVSNCDDGLAQYNSTNISNEFHIMKDGFEISLDLQDKHKFCCSVIELKMDTSMHPTNMKIFPGIYRVDPKTQTSKNWVFESDNEAKPIIMRNIDDDHWYIGRTKSKRQLKFKGGPARCVEDVHEFYEWKYKRQRDQEIEMKGFLGITCI